MNKQGIDADEVDVNTLLAEGASLVRDANRWRKLEMLIERMIEHEPQWSVLQGTMDDPSDGTYLTLEELIEEIDKVDPVVSLRDRISKD